MTREFPRKKTKEGLCGSQVYEVIKDVYTAWNKGGRVDDYELEDDRCRIRGRLIRRQKRGDLVLLYKIIHGLEHGLRFEDMFQWHLSPNLRGHTMRLRTKMSKLNLRSEFFTQRVVQHWNNLPQSVVEAASLQIFKKRLDDYICPLLSLDSMKLS
ncbi:hypothetical protein SprV_0301287300 [Sparganum proliferum]